MFIGRIKFYPSFQGQLTEDMRHLVESISSFITICLCVPKALFVSCCHPPKCGVTQALFLLVTSSFIVI
jgi:hypothetical protein